MNERVTPIPAATKREQIQLFLNEINAVAIRLRHPSTVRSGGGDSVPAAAFDVLRMLQCQGPQAVPNMARAKSTSRQNIQIVVNRLKASGFVRLSPNPAHKRSELVGITASGEAALRKAEGSKENSLEDLAGDLSEAELAMGIKVLRKVRKALAGEISTQAHGRNSSPQASARHEPGADIANRPGHVPGNEENAVPGDTSSETLSPRHEIHSEPEPPEADENELPVNLL